MFERSLKLTDEELLTKIKNTKILLVGIGGVGGFTFECLIRLGFQNITIIDHDKIEESNLNRQLISNQNNLGKTKVSEAKKRALEINPNVKINPICDFLNQDNIADYVLDFDYIIDACDTLTTKLLLIKRAKEINAKIITCLGTGNRYNPNLIEITTLEKTSYDPLAKNLRSLMRKNNLSLKTPVVWSREEPIKTKLKTPSSLILVPSCAGITLAYFVLNDLKST